MSNQCITWEGGDIPCLGICNGDDLDQAEKIIADKICDIMSDMDMSKVDITCILDTCTQRCEDKSLKSIVQLLFDNQCCIKDLIDNISGGSTDVEVNLNMRCLKKFDDFGNEIPQNLNQSLQSLINQVCSDKEAITSLQAAVNDLQDQIDNLPDQSGQTEPSITTCITPGLKPISVAVPLIAQDYCNYKNIVGQDSDVSAAMSKQCPNLNIEYQTVEGWNLTVDNFAKSVNNLWIVLCDIRNRVKTIEDTCCKLTCDDIEIGFDVVYNETGDGVLLRFTSKAGTSIPFGFTDCGSYVTLTDVDGVSVKYNLEVSNNAEEGDFLVNGLNLGDFITVEVTAKLCTEGLTCEKCAVKLWNPNNATCPYCEIKVEGSPSSSVVIIYEELGVRRVLVIHGGETGVIKKNVKILSVGINGDAEPSSVCTNVQTALANAEAFECFEIAYAVDDNPGGGTSAWDLTDPNAKIVGFGYADTLIELNLHITAPSDNVLSSNILSNIPNGIFIGMTDFSGHDAGDRGTGGIFFKTLPSLQEEGIYLKFSVPGASPTARIYAVTSTRCAPDESVS